MGILINRNNYALNNFLSKPENKRLIFELFDSFEEWYKNKSFMYLKTTIEDKALDELIAIKDQK